MKKGFIFGNSYLIFCKTHLDNPIRVLGGMKGITIISLPAIKVWRIFTMPISSCHLGQELLLVAHSEPHCVYALKILAMQ